jgi:hypothetical protein
MISKRTKLLVALQLTIVWMDPGFRYLFTNSDITYIYIYGVECSLNALYPCEARTQDLLFLIDALKC